MTATRKPRGRHGPTLRSSRLSNMSTLTSNSGEIKPFRLEGIKFWTGNERKEKGGGGRRRVRLRAEGSIARHGGSCWGFREPDKEGHLYLARRDREKESVRGNGGEAEKRKKKKKNRKRKKRGQSFNKEFESSS
ncbi:hypothetical protein PUN28_017314 [Cardiocondyla obscurior]|uniref:Uncharacterized protein n=1 Tax=Cardiocondyla obscurior TaxID=286306 RepID=A0AAW2ES59_9HYME